MRQEYFTWKLSAETTCPRPVAGTLPNPDLLRCADPHRITGPVGQPVQDNPRRGVNRSRPREHLPAIPRFERNNTIGIEHDQAQTLPQCSYRTILTPVSATRYIEFDIHRAQTVGGTALIP